MDFTLNESQQLLSDSVERFLADKYDLPTRRRLADDSAGRERLWHEMAELGWMGAAFPESLGGFADSHVDAMVVMERFGRHLMAEPYLITAILAGKILEHGVQGELRDRLIGEIISGQLQLAVAAGGNHALYRAQDTSFVATRSGSSWVINGRMPVVLNGDRADQLIIAARTGGSVGERTGVTLFLVDARAPQITRRGFRMLDGHSAAEISIEALEVGVEHVVGSLDCALRLLTRALDHGVAAVCAEAVGSMTYLVQATCEHTKTREQYGAPLAKFQVLQHRMADMYIQTVTARSMAYVATLSLDLPVMERMRAASAAKAQVGRSGKFVGYQAVQLHGGMGMTEELDVGWHYLRLTFIDRLFGDQSYHWGRFADLGDALLADATHDGAEGGRLQDDH